MDFDIDWKDLALAGAFGEEMSEEEREAYILEQEMEPQESVEEVEETSEDPDIDIEDLIP